MATGGQYERRQCFIHDCRHTLHYRETTIGIDKLHFIVPARHSVNLRFDGGPPACAMMPFLQNVTAPPFLFLSFLLDIQHQPASVANQTDSSELLPFGQPMQDFDGVRLKVKYRFEA